MKTGWVNLIIKLTSVVQVSKTKLLATHAFNSIFLVILIIFCELLLAIISFPLYLVESTNDQTKTNTKEYKTRRAITLSVVAGIIGIWLIKLALILGGMVFLKDSSEISISETITPSQVEITQEQILNAQQASLNKALAKPTLSNLTYSRETGIQFSGKATKNQQILLYLHAINTEAQQRNNPTLTIIATETNDEGNFSVIPDSTQFRFQPGKYQIEAVALDTVTKTFSEPSASYSFMIENNLFESTRFLSMLDSILNVSIFIFILIGIILTLLIT
jgi:hypothetical protein